MNFSPKPPLKINLTQYLIHISDSTIVYEILPSANLEKTKSLDLKQIDYKIEKIEKALGLKKAENKLEKREKSLDSKKVENKLRKTDSKKIENKESGLYLFF